MIKTTPDTKRNLKGLFIMIKQKLSIFMMAIFIMVMSAAANANFANEVKLLASDAAIGDEFGSSVSISGDTIIVGAHFDDLIGNNDNSGSAYVYVRDSGTGVWTEQQKLTPSDGTAGAEFGKSVSISGDTAIVGTWRDTANSLSSAYVFVRDPDTGIWTEQQKLLPSDGVSNDRFGISVSISGDTAIVGSDLDDDNGDNSGSAYVFVRDPDTGVWTEQPKLTASDGAASEYFGRSVSINGDTAIVGAPGQFSSASISGFAYVFVRDPGTGIWTEQPKLTAFDGRAADEFGISVSISGDRAIVGARAANNRGAAYVFVRNPGSGIWTLDKKIFASDGQGADYFGISVSISGETAIVGAWWADPNGIIASGSAYIYVRDINGNWPEQKLVASDGANGDFFGNSVSISGDTAIGGAHGDDGDTAYNAGSAYVYTSSVTTAPDISVTPVSHNFNSIIVNGFSAPLEITLSNIGAANLSVLSMLLNDTQNFILSVDGGSNPCGIATPVIASGQNCTLSVTFKPQSETSFNVQLFINSDSTNSPSINIAMSGTGVTVPVPNIAVNPAINVFSDVVVNQASSLLEVTVSNTGNAQLDVSDISLTTGTNYSVNLNAGSSPCAVSNPMIAVGNNCTVGVTFAPTVVQNSLADSLIISSNDPDEITVSVQLSGNGVSETPPPSGDVTPPVVISVTPTRNASNVPATIGGITATFNEPVQGINVATFIASSTSGDVAATVEYDATAMTAWLRPAADLTYSTSYTVTISSDQVRDLAENKMALDYSWSFTTGGDPALAGCEPELQVEEGCDNFDHFTYGAGVSVNTYGSSVTGFTSEAAARHSVFFEVPLSEVPLSEDLASSAAFESEASARVDSTQFSLHSRSRRMESSQELAGAWSMGATKIDVSGLPPGALIPMSIVTSGSYTGNGGSLMLQVRDFDSYTMLGSESSYGSSGDIRVDFLYPAIPNNGIYVWFVAGVHSSLSSGETDYTATLEVNPPPGVTVSLASGQVFTGVADTDGDGVADIEDSSPNDASIASLASATGTGSIAVDVSNNAGATLSQIRVLDDDDSSLAQSGKPTDQQFPDGLVSFRINGIAPGGTATVNLSFPTAFPDGAKYYKVNETGFYEFPGAVINGNTVTLTITDGGLGDNDDMANGVIVDPGGIAIPIVVSPVTTSPVTTSSNSSSSGLFGIGAFDPLMLLALFMWSVISLVYRRRR